MPHTIDFDISLATEDIRAATADEAGPSYFGPLIECLRKYAGADFAFIARSLDHPASRVSIIASSTEVNWKDFDLEGTPCALIYEGTSVYVHEGLHCKFEGPKDSGFEGFAGYPFYSPQGICVGHLALFFRSPINSSRILDTLVKQITPRTEKEFVRLDMEARLATQLRRSKLTNDTLAKISCDLPLDAILNDLILGLETENSSLTCSVMSPDKTGSYLTLAAGPSLPPEYALAVHQVPIAPDAGSCGTAAWAKQRVVTESIATDPKWNAFRQIALDHGLAACWSEPILDPNGVLLGVIASYRSSPSTPSQEEIDLITAFAQLAGIAIAHHHTRERLRIRRQKSQIFLETATDGIIVLDDEGRLVELSNGFVELTATPRQTLATSHIWQWDSAHDEQGYRRLLERCDEHPVSFATRIRDARGESHPVEMRIKAFKIDDEILYWASAREISHHAEQEDSAGILSMERFQEELTMEFQRGQRHNRPLSLLLIHLDQLEGYRNLPDQPDTSEILKKIGIRLRLELRKEDRLALGPGDTLALILPESTMASACKVSQRMRQVLARTAPRVTPAVPHATCSIGVALLLGHEASPEELVTQAQVALQIALDAGGNQVSWLEH